MKKKVVIFAGNTNSEKAVTFFEELNREKAERIKKLEEKAAKFRELFSRNGSK